MPIRTVRPYDDFRKDKKREEDKKKKKKDVKKVLDSERMNQKNKDSVEK